MPDPETAKPGDPNMRRADAGDEIDSDDSREEGLSEEQAAKALNRIEALRRRLEPRG